MTPSNANTSGLVFVGEARSMPGASMFTMAAFKASDVPVGTLLVTAASAQARIDAEKARADRLAKGLKDAHDQFVTIGALSTDDSVRLFARGCSDSIRALQQEG